MPAASTAALPPARLLTPLLARAWDLCLALVRSPQPDSAADSPPSTPWRQYWGETYGPDLKKWLLKPLFDDLEKSDRLGGIIIDAGSGAHPVTQLLAPKPARRRILIDIAADESCSPDALRLRLDVEKVTQPHSLTLRRAIIRARRFLPASAAAADTIIFSDLLNYVDFRAVLAGASRFLKPGGRFIIVNLPIRGNQSLFSERGLKDNHHLYAFLDHHHFQIEHKSFPCRPRGATDESEELIILVARKPLTPAD